jgi:hypothetical protein
MLHTFVALVQDKPGVIARVASLAFVMSAFLPMHASAQQIHVKVLNAKNGKPFNHVNLTVGTAGPQTSSFHIETDHTGLALVQAVPNGSISVYVMGYQTDCRPSLQQQRSFPFGEIVTKGITIANSCGKAMYAAAPGELVLFVRNTTFMERD